MQENKIEKHPINGQKNMLSSFKRRVKSIVEQSDTKTGKIFDLIIQALIFISLITFSIETLPNISPGFKKVLRTIEFISVILFSMEYVLRIWVCDSSLRFIFSFYGLIDILAILPFYISGTIDLRSLRIFRFLRLFRILKIVRYSKALRHFQDAFLRVKQELVIYMIVTMFLLYLSSVGIYYFEQPAQPENFKSIFHAMWWSVATLTTVGYGDIYPITVGGKIFTFCILMLGLGIIAIPSGLIASAFTRQKDDD